MSRKRYVELDGLRGIAALMVFLFHFVRVTEEYNWWFEWCTTGVDLFFIISGFVITMSIEHVKSGREFIINRLSRLYPTYWASVTFTFVVFTWVCLSKGEAIQWTRYLGNMTMFQYYMDIPDLDGPYWTMIIEMLFYILVLLIFSLNLFRHILLIGSLLCLGILSWVLLYWNEWTESWFVTIPLLQFFPLFFAGIVFYKIRHQQGHATLNWFLVIMALTCEVLIFDHVGRSRMFMDKVEYAIVITLYFAIFSLLVKNYVKILGTRIFVFLGKISYALYLTHYYISSRHVIPYFYNECGYNFWFVLIINLGICILISATITYLIEVPANKKLRNTLNRLHDKLFSKQKNAV